MAISSPIVAISLIVIGFYKLIVQTCLVEKCSENHALAFFCRFNVLFEIQNAIAKVTLFSIRMYFIVFTYQYVTYGTVYYFNPTFLLFVGYLHLHKPIRYVLILGFYLVFWCFIFISSHEYDRQDKHMVTILNYNEFVCSYLGYLREMILTIGIIVCDHKFYGWYVDRVHVQCKYHHDCSLHKYIPVGVVSALFYCLRYVVKINYDSSTLVHFVGVTEDKRSLHGKLMEHTGTTLRFLEQLDELCNLKFSNEMGTVLNSEDLFRHRVKHLLKRYEKQYTELSIQFEKLPKSNDKISTSDSVLTYCRESVSSDTHPSTKSSKTKPSHTNEVKKRRLKKRKPESREEDSISQLTGLSWPAESLQSHESDEE